MNQFGLYTYTHGNVTVKLCIAILYKQKCLFFKNGEQEGSIGPVWGLAPVGAGRILGNGVGGEYGGNMMYSCTKMGK
jgi:hypothetical protein